VFSRIATLLALVATSVVAWADDADPVVVHAGSAVLRASDVARRLAAMPSFQLAAFGKSPG